MEPATGSETEFFSLARGFLLTSPKLAAGLFQSLDVGPAKQQGLRNEDLQNVS